MTRSARLAVGVVLVVVLLVLAAVSALVVATALLRQGPSYDPIEVTTVPAVELLDPVEVTGQVLDLDEDQTTGYASMEVAFDDGAGGSEVATVQLGLIDGTPLPQVGEDVELVHERDDPSHPLLSDDPVLRPPPPDDLDRDGVPDETDRAAVGDRRDGARLLARRFGLLAAGALVAAALTAVVTVVAVRRAPRAGQPVSWRSVGP